MDAPRGQRESSNMSAYPTIEVRCRDCETLVNVPVGAPEDVLCGGENCRRRYRAFGKRPAQPAIDFYLTQPSTRRKWIEREDGRFIVSFVYDEVPRYIAHGLRDIVDNLESLQLLLTGLCAEKQIPMVIMYPEFDYAAEHTSVRPPIRKMERLDYLELLDIASPVCRLSKVFASGQCFKCDEERSRILMEVNHAQAVEPRFYACWLGRTEFEFPLVVHHATVAVLITGQTFTDSPKGRAELDFGIENLEAEYPELRSGVQLSAKAVADAGIKEVEPGHHLGTTEGSINVTSAAIKKWIVHEGETRPETIHDDETLRAWSERLKKDGKVITDYLESAYLNKRERSQNEFLDELFALIECFPTYDPIDPRDTWDKLCRILRRLCQFTGFKYGAIVTPSLYKLDDLEVKVTCSDAALECTHPVDDDGIPRRIAEVSFPPDFADDLFDRHFRATSRSEATRRLVSELHGMIATNGKPPQCGYVFMLRLDEPERDLKRARDESDSRTFPSFALFALWERVPRNDNLEIRNWIGPQVERYLARISHELTNGLQKWFSMIRLQQSELAHRQFVANGMHTLKSSLHSIRADIDQIEDWLEEASLADEFEELEGLVDEIAGDLEVFGYDVELTNRFATADAGKAQYSATYEKPLVPLVRQCIRRLRGPAMRRNIKIELDSRVSDSDTVKCDPTALETAILALLDNALKYSFDDRKVTVRVLRSEKTFNIEIDDYGQGVLPSDAPFIFDKFYRAKSVDPRRHIPGTGIGLTVARDVARAHGGDATFVSNRGEPPSGVSDPSVRGFRTVFTLTVANDRGKGK